MNADAIAQVVERTLDVVDQLPVVHRVNGLVLKREVGSLERWPLRVAPASVVVSPHSRFERDASSARALPEAGHQPREEPGRGLRCRPAGEGSRSLDERNEADVGEVVDIRHLQMRPGNAVPGQRGPHPIGRRGARRSPGTTGSDRVGSERPPVATGPGRADRTSRRPAPRARYADLVRAASWRSRI